MLHVERLIIKIVMGLMVLFCSSMKDRTKEHLSEERVMVVITCAMQLIVLLQSLKKKKKCT
jgi:hypothetical protein